ncbi:hypothetical protein EON64_20245, partial [archaeon]
ELTLQLQQHPPIPPSRSPGRKARGSGGAGEGDEYPSGPPNTASRLTAALSLIEWDLPRTFPSLAFFHDGGVMHRGLEKILLAYALYDTKIGKSPLVYLPTLPAYVASCLLIFLPLCRGANIYCANAIIPSFSQAMCKA